MLRKRGISFIGIIVFVGLIALIAWGLNYIITKDYVVVRQPIPDVKNNIVVTPVTTANTSITPTSTPTTTPQTIATSTPVKSAVKSTDQTSSDLTVTFTDKGFSPTSLTVKKGQIVTFVNNSSSKMWVSANPFPSASDYPAFNEKTGVASGASWSFTFTQVGTWFYHNHYTPAVGAKIVVTSK